MIDFLAKQLGIPTSNARILYDQWLENALNALSNGKPVTIDGLGSFSFENNELRFSPAPTLELEVNRAYAGLEPLPEEKLGPTKFTDIDFDDPFMEIISPKPFDPTPDPDPEIPQADVFEFPEMEPEPEPKPKPEPEPSEPVRLNPWLTAAVVLLVLAIGGYLGLGWYESWMESKIAAETVVNVAPEQPPQTPTSVEPPSEYGLTGTPAPLEGRVYGIIIHSLPARGDSEAQCAKISPLGFRCSVVAAVRNGATTYRVAIGQFESTDAAQAAVANLPAEYQTPGNFFISRIQ